MPLIQTILHIFTHGISKSQNQSLSHTHTYIYKHRVNLSLTQQPGFLFLFLLLLLPPLSRIGHGLSDGNMCREGSAKYFTATMRILRNGEDDLLVQYSNTTLNALIMCRYFVMNVSLSFSVNFTRSISIHRHTLPSSL